MVMEVEYVHNRNVFEVLTALGNRMEIEKCRCVETAEDIVWQNPTGAGIFAADKADHPARLHQV
jgi:hypothetical protein